uniref:Immunoglobulin domain-containing protein n=1 Tax=Gadus morhua TaxID=8049 RepID=A0A8C5CY69_GADMO
LPYVIILIAVMIMIMHWPLGADPDWHVEYPDSFCVVEGSTATIPCSFTHPMVKEAITAPPAGLRVERVVWCANLEFCWHPVYNGYDSNSVLTSSRFLYLGDLVGNCTLNITKMLKRDAATYRFRIETNGVGWTGPNGVRVNVTGKGRSGHTHLYLSLLLPPIGRPLVQKWPRPFRDRPRPPPQPSDKWRHRELHLLSGLQWAENLFALESGRGGR